MHKALGPTALGLPPVPKRVCSNYYISLICKTKSILLKLLSHKLNLTVLLFLHSFNIKDK